MRPLLHTRRPARWAWLLALLLLIGMAVAWVAAPSLIARSINAGLTDMPEGYRGSIEHVELRPLTAEIALLGLRIEKKNGLVPVPFMEAKELVVGTVRDGYRLRTSLRFVEPVMNYVDAAAKPAEQWGPPFDLRKFREDLPFELITVVFERAQVHFRNFESKPQVDAYLQGANVTWDKLVGCLPPGSRSCSSELHGEADLMKSGRLRLRGTGERAPEPTFELRAALRNLRAPELNPLLAHYAKVDLRAGEVDLDARCSVRGQSQDALLVPRLRDLKVIGSQSGADTSFFRELGLAMVAGAFERMSGDKAIAIRNKPGGGFEFELVDRPQESARRGD